MRRRKPATGIQSQAAELEDALEMGEHISTRLRSRQDCSKASLLASVRAASWASSLTSRRQPPPPRLLPRGESRFAAYNNNFCNKVSTKLTCATTSAVSE